MDNQNVLMLVSELMKRSDIELNRITNLYINDMNNDAINIKNRLIMSLKNGFSSFLGDQFHILEEIVEDNFNNNLNMYTSKLNTVQMQILSNYKRLEIQIQNSLAETSNSDSFKSLINNITNNIKKDIVGIEKQNNEEVLHDVNQFLIGMQNKLQLYFNSVQLTNDSICGGILHTIDIYQHNLLDQIGDKIPTLSFLGSSNIDWISKTIVDKMDDVTVLPSENSLNTNEMSMAK